VILKRAQRCSFPEDTLPAMHRALLSAFLPAAVRAQLTQLLSDCAARAGLPLAARTPAGAAAPAPDGAPALEIRAEGGRVDIGGVSFPQGAPPTPACSSANNSRAD